MSKKLLFFVVIACCAFFNPAVLPAQEWRELASEHFIIYFTQDESFAHDVSQKVERYYSKIASDLGYARFNFWTWDKRVKIYIYPDRASYLAASEQPSWSEGMADYTNKRILSFAHSDDFVDSILPHETAHLIFRDFVGFKGEIPVWLDEGVAQWEEPLKRERVNAVSRQLLNRGTLFSVADMVALDVRDVTENRSVQMHSIPDKDGKRELLLAQGEAFVRTYYIEAVSLVGFLIDYYGAERFTDFCRQLRDGKSLEAALRFVYSSSISSIEEMEKCWLGYLGRN